MSIITRICLIVALLVGGSSIWLGRELTTKVTKLGADIKSATDAKESADKAKKAAEAEAAARKKEADDAAVKLTDANTQLDSQKKAAGKLQEEVDALKKKLAEMPAAQPVAPDRQREIDELKGKLTAAEQALAAATEKTKADADSIKALKDTNATIESEKKVIAEKLKESNAKVAYYEGKDGVALPEGLTGKVLFYDKTWNFAVLDIGKKKGVLPSGVMILHRGTDIVGKVRIATVDDDCCVADFLGDFKKKEPKPGDTAIP